MDLELKRQTECPICLNNYIKPRILTKCGHTVCENCLNTLLKSSYYIICPICNIKSYLKKEEGVNSFKLNYSLISIIDNINNLILKDKNQYNTLTKSVPDNFNYFNEKSNLIEITEKIEEIENPMNCCCNKRKK